VPDHCPEVDSHTIKLEWFALAKDGRKVVYDTHIWRPNNAGNTWMTILGYEHDLPKGYRISAYCEDKNMYPYGKCNESFAGFPLGHFSYQAAYINGGTGECSNYNPGKDDPYGVTTCDSAIVTSGTTYSTVNVYFYWKCSGGIGRC